MTSHLTSTIRRYYAYRFFLSMSFFSAVLVPFFTDWGHLSRFQTQLVQSWFMLWFFILEIPTGAVADYVGRKHSIFLGALVVAAAAFIYGTYPHIGIFLLAEFLFATAMALTSGADEALLYDTLKAAGEERKSKQVMGQAHAFNMAGILVAAPIGSFLASRFGLNAPTMFTALPMLAAAAFAWSIPEPKFRTGTGETTRYLEILKSGTAYLWSHSQLKALAVDLVGVAIAAYFVIWLYQPLLQQIGVPVQYFGWVHMLMVMAEMIIAANFAKLEKWAGSPARYLALSALVTGLMFLLVAVHQSLVTILLFALIAGGVGLSRLQLINIHMQPFIPSSKRATVLSSVSMLRRSAYMVFNPLIGYAADFSLNRTLFLLALFPLAVFFFSPLKRIPLSAPAANKD